MPNTAAVQEKQFVESVSVCPRAFVVRPKIKLAVEQQTRELLAALKK